MELGRRPGFPMPGQGLWVSLQFSPGASWSLVCSILPCPPSIQRRFLKGHHVMQPLLHPCKGPTQAGLWAQLLSAPPACPPPLSPPCLLTKGSTHPGLLVRFVVTSGHLLQLFHPSLRSEPSHLGRDSHLGSLVFHSSGSRYPAPLVAGVGCWSPLRPLLSDLPEDLFF